MASNEITPNVEDKTLDEKPEVNELEFGSSPTSLLKSRFDELSIWRTLWVFRTSALWCVACFTGYLCEGFEVGPHECSRLTSAHRWWFHRGEQRLYQSIWFSEFRPERGHRIRAKYLMG